jgi:diguanylate cyclase (GGDEF)-like protein
VAVEESECQESCTVISLKKYLDMDPSKIVPSEPEMFEAVMESYRSALLAMGKSGLQAYPAVGSDLQQSLASLEQRLSRNITPALIKETEARVTEQLDQWGGRIEEHFKFKTNEVRELLIVMAGTAESMGERDKNYSSQFSQFTTRLRTIANLDDLTQIRASLVKGANELKTCVDQMAQDSNKLVAKLQAEVSSYENKLKAAEDLALRDPLTGLSNRRNVEERIAWRVERDQPFCVAVLDINGLKQVNDKYGHLAGDNLLKQFSQELRSGCRSTDVLGRWGGDEFIIILDGDVAGAEIQIQRLRKWVFGEYTIQTGPGSDQVKINVDASVGLAQWAAGDTLQLVIEHADAAMYKEKQAAKKGK